MFQKQKPLTRQAQIIRNLERVMASERRIQIEVSNLGRVHVVTPKPARSGTRTLASGRWATRIVKPAHHSSRFLKHGPWPEPYERKRAWPYPWKRGSERTD